MCCLFKNYNGGDNSSAIASIKTEKILCINGELCLLCHSGKLWYMNLILEINFLLLSLSENNAKTLNFNQLLIYCSTLTSRHSLTRSTSGICLVINAVRTRKV